MGGDAASIAATLLRRWGPWEILDGDPVEIAVPDPATQTSLATPGAVRSNANLRDKVYDVKRFE